MKKIKELAKTVLDKPVGFSLVNCLTTLVMSLVIFRPYFEEGDDLQIAMIAEGAFGQNDYHLVYPNVIYGRIISALSQILPSVRWHTVMLYVLSILALFCLGLWLSHFEFGRFITVIINASCFYEIFVAVQYTKTVTFAAVSAILIILFFIKQKLYLKGDGAQEHFGKKRVDIGSATGRVLIVLSYIILAFSILIRQSAFFIAVVFALAIGAIHLYRAFRAYGPKCIGIYCAFIIPVFGFALIAGMIDTACYNADANWNYFRYYNEARTSVIDYRYDALDYSRYADELTKMGISENDAYLYLTWQFADENVVTPQLYEKVAAMPGTKPINLDLIKAWIANIYNDIFAFSATVLALLLAVALYFVVSVKGSASFHLVTFEACISAAVLFYYQYSGRWSHRIVYSMIIAVNVVLWAMLITEGPASFETPKNTIKKSYGAIQYVLPATVIIIAVGLIGQRLSNEFEYQEYQRSETNFPVLQMYMEEESDKLFVADTFTVGGWYKYDVFAPMKVGSLKNFVTTGGWSTGSPIDHGIVEKYGYYDPFDALARGDGDVILIDNHCPDRKAIYLSDHGEGPRLAAEYIETVCGYNLYQIK